MASLAVKFSSPDLSPDCPTCGGPYAHCRCAAWGDLPRSLRDPSYDYYEGRYCGPDDDASDLEQERLDSLEGYHIWEGRRPKAFRYDAPQLLAVETRREWWSLPPNWCARHPCSCTGLSHEHDRHACPPEPVPAED